jgi:hypothetical protein
LHRYSREPEKSRIHQDRGARAISSDWQWVHSKLTRRSLTHERDGTPVRLGKSLIFPNLLRLPIAFINQRSRFLNPKWRFNQSVGQK